MGGWQIVLIKWVCNEGMNDKLLKVFGCSKLIIYFPLAGILPILQIRKPRFWAAE
jgi:hypothetical protein